MRPNALATALAGLVFVCGANSAFAVDSTDFAKKLEANFTQPSLSVSFDQTTASGDTVTVSGLTLSPTDEDPLHLPATIVFTGVKETADGGYTADKATVADIDFTKEGADFSAHNIVITGIALAADPKSDILASLKLYKELTLGPVSVKSKEVPVFTIANVVSTNTMRDDGKSYDNTYALTGLHADLSQVDEPEAEQTLAQLGLTGIDGSVTGKSHWNIESGQLDINELKFAFDHLGTFDLTGFVTGYDRDTLKALHDMQTKVAAIDESADRDDEKTTQTLSAFQQVVARMGLGKLALRYDDAGLMPKLMKFLADQSGSTPEMMSTVYAGMLPAFAAQMGLPQETQVMLLNAATAFLKDPKSLTISVAPDAPVPFMALAATAQQPAALVKLLNLNIAANQ